MDIITGNFVLGSDGSRKIRYGNLLHTLVTGSGGGGSGGSPAIPEEGLVFYAPFAEDKAAAETGQGISKNGNVVFETVAGVPCARFDGSSYLTLTPSETEFQFLTQAHWTVSFHAWFELGHDASEDLEGLFCSEEPSKDGALFVYRYVRGLNTGKQDAFGIGVNGSNEFTTPDHVLEALSWHFIAIERNGSALRIRINGAWYEGGSSANLRDALKLYLPGGSPKLKGGIAGFRIYSRLPSEEEYSQLAKEFKSAIEGAGT